MSECKLLRDQGHRMRAQWMAKRDDHKRHYHKYCDDKREKFDNNKYKLNKKEINAIAERKKDSSPGSDRSASSTADSKRSEASSSDSLVSDGDLYSFDQLSIKSRVD